MALNYVRHLFFIEQLEWLVQQGQVWTETLEAQAHALAEHHFGICDHDIDLDDSHFPVLRMMRDESDAYWARHGWDVTDGHGQQLMLMDYFVRPLVCLVERLHPAARFAEADEAWADRLAREAAEFKAKRGTGR